MAKAIRITPPQPAEQFQLTLTLAEAYALRLLTEHAGGNPATTARKFTDDVGIALKEAGIKVTHEDCSKNVTTGISGVRFMTGSLEWVDKQVDASRVTFKTQGRNLYPTGMSTSINGDTPA